MLVALINDYNLKMDMVLIAIESYWVYHHRPGLNYRLPTVVLTGVYIARYKPN